jgi:hypothetical protein
VALATALAFGVLAFVLTAALAGGNSTNAPSTVVQTVTVPAPTTSAQPAVTPAQPVAATPDAPAKHGKNGKHKKRDKH